MDLCNKEMWFACVVFFFWLCVFGPSLFNPVVSTSWKLMEIRDALYFWCPLNDRTHVSVQCKYQARILNKTWISPASWNVYSLSNTCNMYIMYTSALWPAATITWHMTWNKRPKSYKTFVRVYDIHTILTLPAADMVMSKILLTLQ